jgi:hypothetical protein
VRPLAETERVYLAVLREAPVERAHPSAQSNPFDHRRPGFARNGDATIAYQVISYGPLDIVFARMVLTHGNRLGRTAVRDLLHRLARGRRLIIFDRRGMGCLIRRRLGRGG